MPDAIISGNIISDGVQGTINASLTCVDSTPVGSVSGNMTVGTRNFTFSSNSPILIGTSFLSKAAAIFGNVTVTEVGGATTPNCKLFVNGSRLTEDAWEGSFSIAAPDPSLFGLIFTFAGTFTGDLTVFRNVACTIH